jgi:hypothetical protein
MTTLYEQIDATRDRILREGQRLSASRERAQRALVRALRDEAASWQRFADEKQKAAEAAVLELQSRTGIERAVLRMAERSLSDAHVRVRARLGRLDRELAADASPRSDEPTGARPRARRARRAA